MGDSIIPNARRPFRYVEHMTAVLIERLWDRVGPDDDLWIIGDFAYGPKAKDEDWLMGIFSQLPGSRRHLLVLKWDLFTNPLSLYGRRVCRTGTAGGTGTP